LRNISKLYIVTKVLDVIVYSLLMYVNLAENTGSQIYIRGLASPPDAPYWKKMTCTQVLALVANAYTYIPVTVKFQLRS